MENDEKKLVNTISDNLNEYSFDVEKFVSSMSCDHRTIQQKFTGLCLAWIDVVGSSDYCFDGRNEFSHAQCEKIKKFMEEQHISTKMPLI
jgi:hypothetical protein